MLLCHASLILSHHIDRLIDNILDSIVKLLSWSAGERCSGSSDGGGWFSGLFGGWSDRSSPSDDAAAGNASGRSAGGRDHDIESHPIERFSDMFGDDDSTGASHTGHDTGGDHSSWDFVDHSTHNDSSSWDAGSFDSSSGGNVGGGDIGFDAGADFGGDMGGGFGGDMGF